MAGRKSSFLMRTRKVKEGERVEMTHLESQATGKFASLDEAISWVRTKWTEWDARPAEQEDAPATAERSGGMRRFWDNAWTAQGLRRGEALALAAAVLIVSIAASTDGVRGAFGAVGDSLGGLSLSASASGSCALHTANSSNLKWGSFTFHVNANVAAGRTADGAFTMGPDVTLEPIVRPPSGASEGAPEVQLYRFQQCNPLVDGRGALLDMLAPTAVYTLHKGDVYVACIDLFKEPAFSLPEWGASYNQARSKLKVTVMSGDAVAGAYLGSPSPLPSWGSLSDDVHCGSENAKRLILWAYGRGLSNPVFPQDVILRIEFGSFNW